MEEFLEPSPKDLAWKYCQMFKEGEKTRVKCIYCGEIFEGGGIHRFKEHLAGPKGGGPTCQSVPPDVRLLMQQDLDVIIAKRNSQQLKIQEEASDVNLPLVDGSMFSNPFSNFESTPGMRRKKDVGWKHCEMLKNEKRVQIKCNYCAKLFKGGGIHRFKEHLAGRNSGGVPSCTRVPSDVRDLMEQHLSPIVVRQRKKRKSKLEKLDDVDSPPGGEDVYIFADHSDGMITPLRAVAACNLVEVNSDFLLDGEGTSNGNLGKRKSAIAVAASDDAGALIAMGSESTENPIHAIWGRFLYDIGASLDAMDSSFSQPLIDAVSYGQSGIAAPSHQDLRGRILKSLVEEVKSDINQYKTRWVKTGCSLLVEECNSESVLEQAKSVTRFVYNNSAVLNLMRKFTSGNDIVQQGKTRSATNFTALKRMADFKLNLQTMVTSHEWMDCPYSKQPGGLAMDKIVKELTLYKNAEGDLGKKLAIRARGTLLPVAAVFNIFDKKHHVGGYVHSLQSLLLIGGLYMVDPAQIWLALAIRILSQTCSAIGCSHNHIPFEKVYRTRNCLQRQRLTDLVFVQYNLRLRQMVDGNKKQIPEDPISFDDVSLIEDWITQNELFLEDSGSSDWMSLVPCSVNMMPLASSTDESEDVASGFDDFEIFNGSKEV
ncbi:BINDING PROTEIN putative-RELATED [Salix viminalis]|uniref:BINDING PROTEIN putative-RELATED n=1 Tax=Salix viminalis TaxID=40686 RepID=A0A9Q0V4F1_SALVM|nr:BINDING PROTEIN putative-RELATED [Salix viminalis]